LSSVFDELRAKSTPKKKEGYLWVSILLRYDENGNSSVVKSFSRPAKESDIKGVIKDKKTKPVKFIPDTESVDSEDLF